MANELMELLDGGGMGGFQDLGEEGEEAQMMEMMGDEGEAATRSPDDPGVSMDELQSVLKASMDQAVNYAEEELAGRRETAQQFYDGEPLPGDDCLDKTRSKFISRDVHDTVKAILPSILRIFFSGKSVVSYEPQGPEDEKWAEQATQYVNDIVLRLDNCGFDIFYAVFHDALMKALGTVMWTWEENFDVFGQEYTGLTAEEMQMLLSDERVADAEMLGEYMEPMLGMPLYDVQVTYKVSQGGKVRVEAVPPEERLINRSARTIDGSTLYGRRRLLTVSEVVAMGFAFEQVVQLGGAEEIETNEENVERYESNIVDGQPASMDPSLRSVQYCDIYLRVDIDGDGFAELYRIACGGTKYEILEYTEGGQAIELVEDIPYAEFCPDPVPHLATGGSVSENVEDVQVVKSNLMRGVLDSLSRAIFPREEVVANQVNMDDVLNPEIGAIIRTKQPGMIREVVTPFMGREALPVLGFMDEVKANRTGISATTQGLDPQLLQSSTPGAVNAAVSASQTQIEMIARIFAQSGMARFFKGVLKLVKTHQDKVRTVKLRNDWVPIDPSVWNAGMDATVNTALGNGTESERMQALNMIAQKQEQVMQTAGPNNPLCTMAEYRNTMAAMVELAGWPNADQFWLPVEHQQIMQQMDEEKKGLEQQLQQGAQKVAELEWELQSHTQAEDNKNAADAFQKKTVGFKNLVEAAQTAQEVVVDPNAAADEVNATGRFLQ